MKRAYVADLVRWVAAVELIPHRFRPHLLRLSGFSFGKTPLIYGGLQVRGLSPIVIGDEVFVNWNCYLDANATIEIGDECRLGDHVRIITSTHQIGPAQRRAAAGVSMPVRIGKGCWVGSGSVILPGVTVAEGCIIAAGAVVASSTQPHGLYAGVPARRVRSIDDAIYPDVTAGAASFDKRSEIGYGE